MCLFITNKFKLPESKRNYFVSYKVLQFNRDYFGQKITLTSIYEHMEYFCKWNKPKSRPSFGLLIKTQMPNWAPANAIGKIAGGALHTFLYKEDAYDMKLNYKNGNYVVIPVRCYYKDVLAVGEFDDSGKATVAMNQLYIDNISWNRAILEAKTMLKIL